MELGAVTMCSGLYNLGDLGFSDLPALRIVHMAVLQLLLARRNLLGARKGKYGPKAKSALFRGRPICLLAALALLFFGWAWFGL